MSTPAAAAALRADRRARGLCPCGLEPAPPGRRCDGCRQYAAVRSAQVVVKRHRGELAAWLREQRDNVCRNEGTASE